MTIKEIENLLDVIGRALKRQNDFNYFQIKENKTFTQWLTLLSISQLFLAILILILAFKIK